VEKKFKFSDNPSVAKAVYGAVIALLCITAIVIGIVAANNRNKNPLPDDENPPVSDENKDDTNKDDENKDEGNTNETVTFISPVSGTVMKEHSTTTPVYSETLEEWRIHTGIDISTEEGAEVFAAAAGEVTKVYSHPLLGNTVEITHADGAKTVYSNLTADKTVAVGAKVASGEKIGVVGYSAISEVADEVHLHFEMLVNEASVNPLDYISEESKKVSLGITEEEAA
jgi:murein DD-endopeptidase MepM/ murein hydrolase activator NlpD